MSSTATFLWHDYETFGANPAADRPSQFAAIRTDEDLTPLAEPITFYCQQTNDYVPNPVACLITGITPQQANDQGVPEYEFALKVNRLMSEPNTCVVGYNNIQFDDEVSRYLFYRNFLDPYAREWQNHNSRWDLINPMRLTWALRPEGINWPSKEDGSPSFRLEDLTKANGIDHQNAHDATSDVWATIAIAKRLKDAQPKLFDFLFQHRQKHQALRLLSLQSPCPIIHSSGRIPGIYGSTSAFIALLEDPTNRNKIWTWDLRESPELLLDLDTETLAEHLYSDKETLESQGHTRPALKGIHINKCPTLAPLNTLTSASEARIQLSKDTIERHGKLVLEHLMEIRQKVKSIAQASPPFPPSDHPERTLYEGFMEPADRDKANRVIDHYDDISPIADLRFNSERINALWSYFKGRHAPALLNDDENTEFYHRVHQRLFGDHQTPGELATVRQELNHLMQEHQEQPSQLNILEQVARYYDDLEMKWSARPL